MSDPDRHHKTVRHYDLPGHAHFLTFSCFRRLPLLSKDRTRLWLVDAIARARDKHRFDLWGWVIMPEHVHLLIWPREPNYRIASILKSIKQPVGYRAIQYLDRRAPAFLGRLTTTDAGQTARHFWQIGPGHDKNVIEPRAVHELLEYIHKNPVLRGLVSVPEEWLWSSAADWAGRPTTILRVDRTIPSVYGP